MLIIGDSKKYFHKMLEQKRGTAMEAVKFLLTGDTSVLVEFGNAISTEINAKIRAFNIVLKKSGVQGITETVSTYRSLSVHYRPEIISYTDLIAHMQSLLENLDAIEIPPAKIIEIPVIYGGEYGPDIDFVAEHNKKTVQEVIQIHSSQEYLIYMLGFAPGFPYLGGMSKEIATPRLTSPRIKIPAGSVGIAGEQTGAYPFDSPGGWQLIGRTPLRLYDVNRATPILLSPGGYVKFSSITQEEYDHILTEVEAGSYQYRYYDKVEA